MATSKTWSMANKRAATSSDSAFPSAFSSDSQPPANSAAPISSNPASHRADTRALRTTTRGSVDGSRRTCNDMTRLHHATDEAAFGVVGAGD